MHKETQVFTQKSIVFRGKKRLYNEMTHGMWSEMYWLSRYHIDTMSMENYVPYELSKTELMILHYKLRESTKILIELYDGIALEWETLFDFEEVWYRGLFDRNILTKKCFL